MPTIIISDNTKRLIDDRALPGCDIRQTATRLDDGRWSLPVDDEVAARIEAERTPGESDHDV